MCVHRTISYICIINQFLPVRPPHQFIHMHHILIHAWHFNSHFYILFISILCMVFHFPFFHITHMHFILNIFSFQFNFWETSSIYIYGKQNCPLTWSSSNNSLAPHIKASRRSPPRIVIKSNLRIHIDRIYNLYKIRHYVVRSGRSATQILNP